MCNTSTTQTVNGVKCDIIQNVAYLQTVIKPSNCNKENKAAKSKAASLPVSSFPLKKLRR